MNLLFPLFSGSNICSHGNGGCQHFCFAIKETIVKCSCATHYSLGPDGKSCVEPQSFLLVNRNTFFLRILYGDGIPDYALPITDASHVGPVQFDDLRNYVYWLHSSQYLVHRIFQNGSRGIEVIDLLTTAQRLSLRERSNANKIQPYDFALDPFSNTIFWTDKAKNTINFLNIYTQKRGVVFSKSGYFPRKITAYPEKDRLFWTSYDEKKQETTLLSITFAGTDKLVLRGPENSIIKDVVIDHSTEFIYYLDTKKSKIESLSLEGESQVKYPIKSTFRPISIATNKKDIFYVADDLIYKLPKTASSGDDSVAFHGRYEGLSQIIAADLTRRKCELNVVVVVLFIQ